MLANRQRTLASSVHLACRPREHSDGSLIVETGEWREVLAELPQKVHEWMPRLAADGIVGADAIFACIGPALEVFSRFGKVERANGEAVTLKEYLEEIWAAVAKEALNMIFKDADTSGFEADARLTVIWFWGMKVANGNGNGHGNGHKLNGQVPAAVVETVDADDEAVAPEEEESDAEATGAVRSATGFAMEFDAARLLAQGLGVEISELSGPGGILAVAGPTATLLNLRYRAVHLIGQQLSFLGEPEPVAVARTKRGPKSAKLKAVSRRKQALLDPEPAPLFDRKQPFLPGMEPPKDERTLLERMIQNGKTLLDRLHQAMLLFSRGQSSLLAALLRETNVGANEQFWRLAQALSALYPSTSEEKRWVDGVLGRKKALGM